MIFVSGEEIEKLRREMHSRLKEGISEELRGWNWDRPPMAPYSQRILFGISALANRYCETYRDIYLRYVLRKKVPISDKLIKGLLLHKLVYNTVARARETIIRMWPFRIDDLLHELTADEQPVRTALDEIAKIFGNEAREGLEAIAISLHRFLVRQTVCEVEKARMKYTWPNVETVLAEALPSVAEKRVDGSRLGLSKNLSIDLLEGNIILEIKTGEMHPFHKYTIAGYALVLEAETGVPHDAGMILYIRFLENGDPIVTSSSVIVDDALRREFLAIRDEAMEIVDSGIDPGMPAKCPSYCPWRSVCHG